MKKILLASVICLNIPDVYSQVNRETGYPEYEFDSCYFDDGNCDLMHYSDSNHVWEIAIPEKSFFEESYSPEYALMTEADSAYPANNSDYVQFDLYNLYPSYYGNIWIDFWHKFEFDSLKDGGKIEIAFDSSAFYNISHLGDEFMSEYIEGYFLDGFQYSAINTFGDSDTGFTGNCNDWKYSRIWIVYDIYKRTSEVERTEWIDVDTTRVRFYLKSDSVDGGEAGWIIDNFVYGSDYASAIDEQLNSIEIKTYPNPVSDKLFMYAEGISNLPVNLLITDINGNIAKQSKLNSDGTGNFNCDVSSLPAGLYFIEILTADNHYTGKFVRI